MCVSWKTVVLPEARRDYYRAMDYLSGFYTSTPRKFYQAYEKILRQLEFNPRCCSPYPGNPAYRRAIVGKYTMLYQIVEERHEVHILRIIRSTWNIPALLEDEPEE